MLSVKNGYDLLVGERLKSSYRGQYLFGFLLVLSCLLVSASLNFGGFQGWIDDQQYVLAARSILQEGLLPGENHWQNRWPFNATMAISFYFFGVSFFSTAVPSLIAYFGLGILTFVFCRRLFGFGAAVTICIVLLTTPQVGLYATIPYPFMLENFLFALAVFGFIRASEHNDPHFKSILIFVGITLGLSILIRPFIFSAILLMSILYIRGYGFERRYYWLLPLGMTPVVVFELLRNYMLTGDLLHRFKVDALAMRIPSDALVGRTFEGSPFFNTELMSSWVPYNPFPVHWTVDPYLLFLSTGGVGGLGWAALLCLLLIRVYQIRLPREILLLLLFGAFWFLTVTYLFSSRPVPRYYGPTIVSLSMFVGFVIHQALRRGRSKLLTAIMIALIFSNLILISARWSSNYEIRAIYRKAQSNDLVISVPPDYYARIKPMLAGDLYDKVLPFPAPEASIKYIEDNELCNSELALKAIKPPFKPLTYLVGNTLISDLLPTSVRKKLLRRPTQICFIPNDRKPG